MSQLPGIALSSLLSSTENVPHPTALAALSDADVIIGRDIDSNQEFVVFGRDTLQRVAQGEDAAAGYNILCVEVDLEGPADDLTRLIELVEQLKGRHEFIDFEGRLQ